MYCDADLHSFSIPYLLPHTQADAQDFERLLMEEPLLTVRDLGVEFKNDTGEVELLRNYEFNISQGIVQSVSRFFDALALMDERGEVPPARVDGGKYADSARGGVMGFGRKRNVCNQEKSAHTVVWEQQVHPAVMAEKAEKERIEKEAEEAATAAARKAAEQDTKLATLESQAAAAADEVAVQSAEVADLKAKVAEMQALAAPSLQLCALSHPRHTFRPIRTLRSRSAPSAPSAVFTSAHTMQSMPSPPLHHLRPPQELAAWGLLTEVV
jgi:hypothetical protein